jgi:hypothetical protein
MFIEHPWTKIVALVALVGGGGAFIGQSMTPEANAKEIQEIRVAMTALESGIRPEIAQISRKLDAIDDVVSSFNDLRQEVAIQHARIESFEEWRRDMVVWREMITDWKSDTRRRKR